MFFWLARNGEKSRRMQSSLLNLAKSTARSHKSYAPILQTLSTKGNKDHISRHKIHVQDNARIFRWFNICGDNLWWIWLRMEGWRCTEPARILGPFPTGWHRNSGRVGGEAQKFGPGPDCVIYDPFIPWALDVAKKFGLFGAAFFTQSCSVNTIYYHVKEGHIKLPLLENQVFNLPGLPPLESSDMPSFLYDFGSCPGALELLVNQFKNIGEADWIFVNTFYKLEKEVCQILIILQLE